MGFMRAAVLANYLDVAKAIGVDAHAQMRRVGLRPSIIETPDALISTDAIVSLLDETARIGGADTVGLRMSQPRSMSGFGVVGLLLAQQPTIRDALQMVFRYQPLINPSLALRLEESGDKALLMEEVITDTVQSKRQTTELALAANLKLFRNLLGADWAPRAMYFRHSAPVAMTDHQRIFRCRCIFDADFNAMSFPRADLDAPNPNADPALGRYAAGLIGGLPGASRNSVTASVRRLVHLLMPLQRATVKEVAQAMGCSVRKLQLDLADESAVFSALLDEARREQAYQYLSNPNFDITQVASLLGYQQTNSFTRWFGANFDMAPREWRKLHGMRPDA